MHTLTPIPAVSKKSNTLSGVIHVPGDKSISHRALMLGAISLGKTTVQGLLEGEDILRTAAAMEAMGAHIQKEGDIWTVIGVGNGNLQEPLVPLDFGNAGTGVRLTMGLVATHPMTTVFYGDPSLTKRPMGRILTPLHQMGATSLSREGHRLPVTLKGALSPVPIRYVLPVASAQIKSAVLLAGLSTPGVTMVVEREPSRDHTERMLTAFGAEVIIDETEEGRQIGVRGFPTLTGQNVVVPGDISSAAFPLVAALIAPESQVAIMNVGLNPLRTGIIETLQEMGGDIQIQNPRFQGGEPVGDLVVTSSRLKGIHVPASRAPRMIDEYPILCAAAAVAEGTSVFEGLGELRVKESDRLAAMAQGLQACGVRVEEKPDGLIIHGGAVAGGAKVQTFLDHRIAMTFLVLGGVAKDPIMIDDSAMINTSFPRFIELMSGIGACMENV